MCVQRDLLWCFQWATHTHYCKFADKRKSLPNVFVSVSTGPHRHKQQTHVSRRCVCVCFRRAVECEWQHRLFAGARQYSYGWFDVYVNIFTCFTWNSLLLCLLYSSPINTFQTYVCVGVVFVQKVWLFWKLFLFFFALIHIERLKISRASDNGSGGTRQAAEWEGTSFSMFILQATCCFFFSFILFAMT